MFLLVYMCFAWNLYLAFYSSKKKKKNQLSWNKSLLEKEFLPLSSHPDLHPHPTQQTSHHQPYYKCLYTIKHHFPLVIPLTIQFPFQHNGFQVLSKMHFVALRKTYLQSNPSYIDDQSILLQPVPVSIWLSKDWSKSQSWEFQPLLLSTHS